ncbi:MAG: phosphatidylglycerophosphatase A [Erysipelotrichaceae bacterium]|nr:phosphatidylglycerophosphatase A [Erysipelotrichaceae bacterium]
MFEKCVGLLAERGVQISDIVECVEYLQKGYDQSTPEMVYDAVVSVLKKREVQHVIITGVFLDRATEQGIIDDADLQRILVQDYSLYGVDEVLAYGICNLYGSIALTNFGYIDKDKPLIIKQLNEKHEGICNTFLDDIVGAIAASAASRIAHGDRPL